VFSASSDLGRNIGRYDFDAIIVGSDQVWRPKYARGILSDFFLGFVPEDDDKVRRISYAPSFGASDWEFDAGQTAVAKRLIQRFTAVSVREDSGVALCRDHLGVEAQHVLDPTLLLTPEHYARLFDFRQRKSSGDRLLTYILDGNDDKARVTDAIAARLSLRPFSTSGQPSGPADAPGGPGGDKTVEGWLAAFHDAAFVVTDSFHGVAFSILFNKPFIAYGNPGRGLARFTSLLKMFGLEDRLVVSSKDVDLDGVVQPVDWSTVNDRLSRLRGDSLRFLTSALTGASPGLARPFAAPAAEADAAPRRRPGHPEGQATFEVSSVALHRAPLTTTAARKAPSELKNATTLALKDNERFVNSYAQGVGAARARLMFAAHAIEKGLSHLNFRAGFGKSPVEKLAKEMEDWLAEGHPADDQFFKAAASALHVYFERHKELNFDVSRFWGLFSTRVQDLILAADDSHGGVLEAASVREAEVEDFRSRSFLDVIYGRRSIREFASDPVRDEDIQRAVRIAQQSPSVCNRQAPRVHLFKDRDAIQSAITLQRGFSGYKMPPRLLLVTSDLTAFLSPTERNQAYIDGGLFMMSLLLGLEQQGLGSCCLNTAMSADRENAIREVLKIPETEIFIAFIAVGHFDRAILTPRSIRLPVEEVLVTYD
jgi:nitroreductase